LPHFCGRSLTQNTDESLSRLRLFCASVITYILSIEPEGSGISSNAHTYRLLIFKDRCLHLTKRCVRCSREARLCNVSYNSSTPSFSRFASLSCQRCVARDRTIANDLAVRKGILLFPYFCILSHTGGGFAQGYLHLPHIQ